MCKSSMYSRWETTLFKILTSSKTDTSLSCLGKKSILWVLICNPGSELFTCSVSCCSTHIASNLLEEVLEMRIHITLRNLLLWEKDTGKSLSLMSNKSTGSSKFSHLEISVNVEFNIQYIFEVDFLTSSIWASMSSSRGLKKNRNAQLEHTLLVCEKTTFTVNSGLFCDQRRSWPLSFVH